MISATRITVTTTPTRLAYGSERLAAGKETEIGARVPSGGSVVYLGGSDVSPSTGFALNGGELFSGNLDSGEALYAVVASGNQVVHVFSSSREE